MWKIKAPHLKMVRRFRRKKIILNITKLYDEF